MAISSVFQRLPVVIKNAAGANVVTFNPTGVQLVVRPDIRNEVKNPKKGAPRFVTKPQPDQPIARYVADLTATGSAALQGLQLTSLIAQVSSNNDVVSNPRGTVEQKIAFTGTIAVPNPIVGQPALSEPFDIVFMVRRAKGTIISDTSVQKLLATVANYSSASFDTANTDTAFASFLASVNARVS